MPTVFRSGGYRVFFWSQDRLNEPAHVHVQHENKIAKFWLAPVRLERSGGFPPTELHRIFRLIVDNEAQCLESWHAFGR